MYGGFLLPEKYNWFERFNKVFFSLSFSQENKKYFFFSLWFLQGEKKFNLSKKDIYLAEKTIVWLYDKEKKNVLKQCQSIGSINHGKLGLVLQTPK